MSSSPYVKLSPEELKKLREKVGLIEEKKASIEVKGGDTREIEKEKIDVETSNINPPNSPPLILSQTSDDLLSEDEFRSKYLNPSAKYTPLFFADPVEMLFSIFPPIISGEIELYDWQIEELLFLSNTTCSKTSPLKHLLSACNGSGKDSYITAPLVIFLSLCRIRSRTVITSASYTQLKNQTENYIRILASCANEKLKEMGICEKAFVIKREHLVCTLTGSEILFFVTDDAGRAEGYHPFPDYPNGEVTIIINEAKTVADSIFEALSRCTYSRWLEISSPEKTSGAHYKHYCLSRYYPDTYIPGEYYHRKVTSFDCPKHISKSKIESDRREYGENSPIYRSKHLALFTSLDEQVVLRREVLDRALQFPPERKSYGFGRRGGLDLAKGGDENTFYIWDENELIGYETFRASDTADVTVPVLIEFFNKWGFKFDTASQIFADDGGVGGAIIDNLHKAGWRVTRVLMQHAPLSKHGGYGNRGAELWFRFARLVEENVLIFHPNERKFQLPDDKLYSQLTSRYYKQHETQGKIILESKKEARAKGHGSPDRADGCVLAWSGISINDFIKDGESSPSSSPASKLTQEAVVKLMDKIKYGDTSGGSKIEEFMRARQKNEGGNFNNKNAGRILNQLYNI